MRDEAVEIDETEMSVERPLESGGYAILGATLGGSTGAISDTAVELPKRKVRGNKAPGTAQQDSLSALSHRAWALLSGGKAAGFDSKLARQLGKLAIIPSRLHGDSATLLGPCVSNIRKLEELLCEVSEENEQGHRKQLQIAEKLRAGRKKLERMLGL